MKPVAAVAALLVVWQVLPSQRTATMRAPNGVDEPLVVLNAERVWLPADAFWPFFKGDSTPADVRRFSLRAIGRVEDPRQVTALMALQPGEGTAPPDVIAQAIAQSLFGFDPARDPDLIAAVHKWMVVRARTASDGTLQARLGAMARVAYPMSHIVYLNDSQVGEIEAIFREAMAVSAISEVYGGFYVTAIRGLEALARVNSRIVHFDDDTVTRLSNSVKNTSPNDGPAARFSSLQALLYARALDTDTEKKALDDAEAADVRRVAVAVLAGTGGGLADEERIQRIRTALADSDLQVRYEAVRAWIRHGVPVAGCAPLVTALKDDDPSVALEAIDALGTVCLDDDSITKRLLAEVRVPGAGDVWNRATHAFVALGKRAPEEIQIPMGAFVTNANWWVRMYAAAAVAAAKDLPRLDKLADDENDNVREVAIGFLRRLDAERGTAATLAALDRADVSLLLAAANWVKEEPPQPKRVAPLLRALQRLTKDGRMTSRDGRLALLDAIEKHAIAGDMSQLLPLLRDYDPLVADRTAAVIDHVAGRAVKAEPVVAPRAPSQPLDDLKQCVTIEMADGSTIAMQMRPDLAPIAVEQFLKLAIVDHYYDGLTFHRVVPNFVVQGGSPGANEYSGSRDYMRDETNATQQASHQRGTVGLSTRGRNTGDAQFFINLVDNPRLDMRYTVFASVSQMAPVYRIQEGAVMRHIRASQCR